jgi:hypothetical protein
MNEFELRHLLSTIKYFFSFVILRIYDYYRMSWNHLMKVDASGLAIDVAVSSFNR